MNLNLAPLTPFNAPPAPGTTSTNPGCTDPASQSFAPVSTDRAISRNPCACPTVTSNGEVQIGNQEAVRAVSTGHGLPRNVLADNSSHSRFIPPNIAISTYPAIDVAAGSGRPGGLAKNVNVK
jgi:hypothetical protein